MMSIVCCEAEACTCVVILVVVSNCILKTACFTNDRNSTVAEAHKLAETAGLKEGGHKECIAGCIDLMGERLGIVDIRANLSGVLICIVTEHILVASLTCTEYHDLNCIAADLVHNAVDKVEALLVCKTGYDTDHHNVGILVETELLLESKLILNLFTSEVISIEMVCNVLI